MKLRMILDKTVSPHRIQADMDYDNGIWKNIAHCNEEDFNAAFEPKLLYTSASQLPPAIRYISPDHSVVLFERPPGYGSIQFTRAMQNEIQTDKASAYNLRLPLPWQRYVMLLNQQNGIVNLFMYFSDHEIQNLHSDPLQLAPMLNFYAKGRLCPALYANLPEYDRTIPGAIDAAMDLIWNSGFNWDTVNAILECRKHSQTPLNNFGENYEKMYQWWATQSIDTVLKWQFPPVYSSFNQLLNSIDLRYEYAGKTDDMVVNFAMSAQVARS